MPDVPKALDTPAGTAIFDPSKQTGTWSRSTSASPSIRWSASSRPAAATGPGRSASSRPGRRSRTTPSWPRWSWATRSANIKQARLLLGQGQPRLHRGRQVLRDQAEGHGLEARTAARAARNDRLPAGQQDDGGRGPAEMEKFLQADAQPDYRSKLTNAPDGAAGRPGHRPRWPGCPAGGPRSGPAGRTGRPARWIGAPARPKRSRVRRRPSSSPPLRGSARRTRRTSASTSGRPAARRRLRAALPGCPAARRQRPEGLHRHPDLPDRQPEPEGDAATHGRERPEADL